MTSKMRDKPASSCTKWLAFTCFGIVYGSSFPCGFLVACMNRNDEDINLYYNTSSRSVIIDTLGTNFHWGLAVAIYSIGAIFGSWASGTLADHFGRRNTLILSNVLLIASSVILSLSTSSLAPFPDLFVFGRCLIGVYFGISSTVAPTFLVEIAPVHLRGMLGSLHQIGFNSGVFVALFVGLPQFLGPFEYWPYLFGTFLVIAPVQLVILPFSPKSPRYLAINQASPTKAREALRRLRAETYNVEDEIQGMISETNNTEPKLSILQVLTKRTLRKALGLALFNQLVQQTNGMVVVLSYSTVVFDTAGLSKEVSGYGTLGTGLMLLTGGIIAINLVDRFGRRPLYLWGLGAQTIAYTSLSLSLALGRPDIKGHWSAYIAIASMILVMGSVSLYFAIAWFITAELFTQGPRPSAVSIAMIANRLLNFYIALVFPLLLKVFRKYTFMYFACSCAVFGVLVYFFLPETKSRTFEEIYAEISGKKVLQESESELEPCSLYETSL